MEMNMKMGDEKGWREIERIYLFISFMPNGRCVIN